METPFKQGRRPLPINPDLIKGFLTTRLCTDIVAPELMDTELTETCTYPLYRASLINANKPEDGYPVHTYDGSTFADRAQYAQR